MSHTVSSVLRMSLVVLGLFPAAAHAQIYSWRDTNGNMVLSNKPQPDAVDLRSYPVPKAEALRATRAVAPSRSGLYDGLIIEHARLNDVREDLVRAVVQVESGFNPSARSPKGAMGLMQLMPATALEFGVRNAFNPAENVRAGVAYLRRLLDRYQNNEQLALAAYNAGPGAVDRHGQNVPPYRETQNYVQQVNQISQPAVPGVRRIYKIVDIIEGRPSVRYTDKKPATGAYEIVGTR